MDNQEVRLVGALRLNKLMKRWPSITPEELVSMQSREELLPYEVIREAKDPTNGEIVSVCRPGGSPWKPDELLAPGETTPLGDYIVFDLKDVERIENEHPDLLWEPAPADKEPEPGYWLRCDALADRWGCSPFDVVEKLTTDDWLGARIKAQFGWECKVDYLNEAEIHIRDLLKWEAENKPHPSGLAGSCASCEALQKEVERLKVLSADGGASQKANTAPSKAIVSAIPAIVQGVLAVKEDWDGAPENSPKKVAGYSEKEIRALLPESISREQARAIKAALGGAGIKVKEGRGTRKTP